MQEGRITEDHMAYPPTHIRITSRNERGADDHCADASRSLEHHDNHEICACGSFDAANRNRHAEPKNDDRYGFWAPFGHRVASNSEERNRSKKYVSKNPLILSLK